MSATRGCLVIAVSAAIAMAIEPSMRGLAVWVVGCVTYRIADAAADGFWS